MKCPFCKKPFDPFIAKQIAGVKGKAIQCPNCNELIRTTVKGKSK